MVIQVDKAMNTRFDQMMTQIDKAMKHLMVTQVDKGHETLEYDSSIQVMKHKIMTQVDKAMKRVIQYTRP